MRLNSGSAGGSDSDVDLFSKKNLAVTGLLAALAVGGWCVHGVYRNFSGASVREQILMERGVSKRKAPESASVSLHAAAFQGNLEAIRRHIEAGSDLNERDPSSGGSPLSTAVVFGRTEAAMALIEAGADVNHRNDDGSTPLQSAAFLCRTEIVEILLANGADKDNRNHAGSSALESVAGPFEDVEAGYDHVRAILEPLGVEMDYERIKATRPKIAEMLR